MPLKWKEAAKALARPQPKGRPLARMSNFDLNDTDDDVDDEEPIVSALPTAPVIENSPPEQTQAMFQPASPPPEPLPQELVAPQPPPSRPTVPRPPPPRAASARRPGDGLNVSLVGGWGV